MEMTKDAIFEEFQERDSNVMISINMFHKLKPCHNILGNFQDNDHVS
jgi:hypothetical protein